MISRSVTGMLKIYHEKVYENIPADYYLTVIPLLA